MEKKITQERVRVVSNKKIGGDYFKLILASRQIASHAVPGQFVEIKVSETHEPLLRRPLGVHRVKAVNFEILCEIVGHGTKLLSQKQANDYIDVIGPLGNGFDLARYAIRDTRCILVAGGMGVAPLLFLAERIACRKPLVLIGAKTKNHILCINEFKAFGCEVKAATEDGSMGFKGRVTDLLKSILHTTHNTQHTTLYACGPQPMLKEISFISKEYGIPAQISLEAHMGCGIGACLGCVVKTKTGSARVCKEGPVFGAQDIVWEGK